MSKPTLIDVATSRPVIPCACANLRRAARLVSQVYDKELRRAGMRGTQFTLLQALTQAGKLTQGIMGEVLGLDSTTLTRTLGLLRSKGWIQSTRGEDRRQLWWSLTSKGAREYRRAKPHWQHAQEKLRSVLGESYWEKLMEASVGAAELVRRY